jgi:hypothetical protein
MFTQPGDIIRALSSTVEKGDYTSLRLFFAFCVMEAPERSPTTTRETMITAEMIHRTPRNRFAVART